MAWGWEQGLLFPAFSPRVLLVLWAWLYFSQEFPAPLKWHFTGILIVGLAIEKAWAWSPKDPGASLALPRVH